jgi:hypothetical protein
MRRAIVVASLLATALLAVGAARAGAAEWRSEQPLGDGGFLANLGEIGDIECWHGEANRCMLITAGNRGVPAGLYAYDGDGWYRYSTVCGGHEGRIAWAGPDEFWTVSDQQAGQVVENVSASASWAISLCHFEDGRVVASYGEPIGAAGAYLHMNAAVCAGPSECWFAGARLPGTVNQGAFHLHWDGSTLTADPSLSDPAEILDPGRTVSGLAYHQGGLYESVRVEEGDVPAPLEKEAGALAPALLHLVEPTASVPFRPLFGAAPFEFGEAGAEASELEGFRLSDDGQRLWAVAGAAGSLGAVTVLQLDAEGLAQLQLEDPDVVLQPGDGVGGLAAEPGRDEAWVAFRRVTDSPSKPLQTPARLTLIHGDGTVGPEIALPAAGEGVERTGMAGPVTCPAPEQCWMATQLGWLFHLGPDPAPNEDPALHGPTITVRPRDDSLPVVPPIELPEDDSGAESKAPAAAGEEVPSQFEELPHRRPPLLSGVKQRLVNGTTLELSFTLRAKARVRLLARRGGRVVARTGLYTMSKGHRSLRLRLDPRHWPTKLDLQVHAVKGASR